MRNQSFAVGVTCAPGGSRLLKILRAVFAEGADEVGGEFFTGDGENTIVAGIFFHDDNLFSLGSCCKVR